MHWIDCEFVPPVAGTTYCGIDPPTGGPGAELSLGTAGDVDRAVQAAYRAHISWRHLGSLERGRVLAAIGQRLLSEVDDVLAAMETADTGKPLALSAAEIRGAAEYFEFHAALVNLTASEVLDIQPNLHVYPLREPLGVIGVITPRTCRSTRAPERAPAGSRWPATPWWPSRPRPRPARPLSSLGWHRRKDCRPVCSTSSSASGRRSEPRSSSTPGAQGRVHRVGAGGPARLLRGAHGLHRRDQRHAHRPGGDLRTGARRHRVRHRGGNTRAGQRTPDYGLVGGVTTADLSRAIRVAEAIEAGQVYINSWSTKSVQMPFGGHKHSGYGREKGIEALNHYSHVKSIGIRISGRPAARVSSIGPAA
jgi:hypothetical protein